MINASLPKRGRAAPTRKKFKLRHYRRWRRSDMSLDAEVS
jgi:hypothetical protein